MAPKNNPEEELYAVVPPNGGWGWVVVFSAFYCNVVADGIQLTFGIFLDSISLDMKTDVSNVALAGSLMFGLHLLMGPVCCGFNSVFGLRPVTIMGSVLCSFGIGISYFSRAYWTLALSFGVIGGIGLGFVYMNTLVITSLYFTTLLPIAIAIVVSGTGVGTMLFSGIGFLLLERTTWQNSLLLQSLMAGSMGLAAAAFRPLTPVRVKLSGDNQLPSISLDLSEYDDLSEKKALLIKTEVPATDSRVSLLTLQTVAMSFVERVISSEFAQAQGRSVWKSQCKCCQKEKDKKVLVLPEIRPQDVTLAHGRTYEEETFKPEFERLSEDDLSGKQSVASYRTVFTKIDFPEESLKQKVWEYLKKTVIAMLDFRLMKKLKFTIFVLIGALQLSAFLTIILYIKEKLEKDFKFEALGSVYLIIVLGVSNMFWRLFLGGIAVIPKVHHVSLASSTMILGGLAVIFSNFYGNHIYQYTLWFLFGMSMGSFSVFRIPFLVELVGTEKIENATGISLMFMGICCVSVPPIIGLIIVKSDSYTILFEMLGAVIAITGVVQIFIRDKTRSLLRPH